MAEWDPLIPGNCAAPDQPITVRRGSDAEEGEVPEGKAGGLAATEPDSPDRRLISRRGDELPPPSGHEEGYSWFDACVM